MHLIQEIGSYAGLAAIPGLAILSALYFSQARDVRRLREWAGRAPERAAEQAQGGRVVPRPAAQPGAQPVAQPAAQPAAQPVAQPNSKPAAQPVAQPAAKPAAAAAAAGAAPATASAAAGGGGTATAAPPRTAPATGAPPAGPRRIAPRVPGTGQTSILGQGAPPEPEPWYRRLADRLPAARYIAILVVGIAVIGGGIAYGITQIGKDSGTGAQSAGKSGKAKKSNKLVPSQVSVSVLNGTSTANLAHRYGTKLDKYGFDVINQVTANKGQVAESVVLFKPGANREARAVADKLHINNIEPADSQSLGQAGAAEVVVVIGADKAPAQSNPPQQQQQAPPAAPAPTQPVTPQPSVTQPQTTP